MYKRLGLRVAAGVFALSGVVAGGAIAGAQEAQPAGQSVAIVDFAFNPATITVAPGTRVTWTNNGQAPHTASSTGTAFDSGRLAPGATFSFTFSTAGSFAYQCNIHPQMRGTVTVQAAAGGAAQPTPAPSTGGAQPPAPRPATVVAPAGQRPAGPVATPVAQRPAAPAAPAAAPRPAAPAAPAALPRTGAGTAGDGAGAPIAVVAGALLLAGAGTVVIRRRR